MSLRKHEGLIGRTRAEVRAPSKGWREASSCASRNIRASLGASLYSWGQPKALL